MIQHPTREGEHQALLGLTGDFFAVQQHHPSAEI
jgi:hypothetical protein